MEHTTKEAGSPSARAKRPSRMQWPIMVRECRCRACGRHLYLKRFVISIFCLGFFVLPFHMFWNQQHSKRTLGHHGRGGDESRGGDVIGHGWNAARYR
jgi:hypothetical protein